MEVQVTLPQFITVEWIKTKLSITDDEAASFGAQLGTTHPTWKEISDIDSFAQIFLSSFQSDPGITADCRRVRGNTSPPIFSIPQYPGVAPVAPDISANEALGHFAELVQTASSQNDTQAVIEIASIELLEYGLIAKGTNALIAKVQEQSEYAELVAMQKSIKAVIFKPAAKVVKKSKGPVSLGHAAPPIPPMPTVAAAPIEPEVSEDFAVSDNPVDLETARQNLLASLDKFASKRWDTDLATQTLKRLVDRRKEVIGQLWEAVETNDPRAARLAEKFFEQFKNNMDARRRLDAVVRLMGRGSSMDPRTQKWFIDSILEISELTKIYYDSLTNSS